MWPRKNKQKPTINQHRVAPSQTPRQTKIGGDNGPAPTRQRPTPPVLPSNEKNILELAKQVSWLMAKIVNHEKRLLNIETQTPDENTLQV